MTRVAVVSPEPTPYRAPLFDRIAERPDIDLTVIYASSTVARRTWNVTLRHPAVVLQAPALPTRRLLHHDYPLTFGVWRELDRLRPECVVVAGWSVLASQLAMLWCRLHSIPYLLMLESHLLDPRPAAVRAVKRLAIPRFVRPATGYLVTGSLAKRTVGAYGGDPSRAHVFANTIDVANFASAIDGRRGSARSAFGLEERDVVVAYVGRFELVKGLDTLVAATAVASALTESSITLLLVGDGTLREQLRQQAAASAVRLVEAGFREGDDLLDCYAAADVFALLSRAEPWGVVVNEAAAAGLPLVLSERVGAAADLLRAGENGALVRVDDVDSAAAAIATLANDPALRNRYGKRSSEIARAWGYEPSIRAFTDAVAEAVAGR